MWAARKVICSSLHKACGDGGLLSRLKEAVGRALEGQARLAFRRGLRPNHVSLLGFLWALLASVAYWRWSSHFLVAFSAPLLVLFSGYSDALDGLMARLYGLESRAGAMLDSFLDRYADAAIIIGVWAGGLCGPLPALLALSGSLLVSYARARAEGLGVDLKGVGLAERAERLLIIMIASWVSLFLWGPALEISMLILVFLTHLTAAQRAAYAFRVLRASASSS